MNEINLDWAVRFLRWAIIVSIILRWAIIVSIIGVLTGILALGYYFWRG